jgi:hypothetical protein
MRPVPHSGVFSPYDTPVAHHVSQPGRVRGGWLPGPRPVRMLIVVVFLALVAILTVPIWYMGGFAAAHVEDAPVNAGEPVTNDLFIITPHSAEFVAEDGGGSPSTTLRLHAELSLRADEAERSSTLGGLMEVSLAPDVGEPERFDTLRLERRPERRVTWVQPAVTETVMLEWTLSEELGSAHEIAEQVDHVRLTVLEAEFEPGFVDQTERWRATLDDGEVAQVLVPITEGG